MHRKIMNSAFVHLSEIRKTQHGGQEHAPDSDESSHWSGIAACLVQLERLSRYERRTGSRWGTAIKALDQAG